MLYSTRTDINSSK